MNEQAQRELRQRRLARETLADYRSRRIPLRRLVQDLQSLVPEFELVSDAWREAFQAETNSLEVVYAVALDRGLTERLPEDFQADVDQSINQLTELITSLDDSNLA